MQPQLSTGLLDQARIRVLLVPIVPSRDTGIATVPNFQQYARQIARHNTVCSTDLRPNSFPSLVPVPAGGARWQDGRLRFNFITELPFDENYLEEFQPYRQVLGVIGVAHCADFAEVEDAHKEFMANTKDFSRSVVRRCIAFEPRDDQRTNEQDSVTVVPRQGDVDTYLDSFMHEFSQQLLDAFGIMTAAIERRSVISMPDNTRPSTPVNGSSAGMSGTMSGTAQQNGAYFRGGSPGNAMSGLTVNNSTTSAASNEAKARKRTPGRAQKLIGDMLVLSGRLPEAVIAYVSAIDQARNNGDYMWQAAAMEGLCAAIGLLSLTEAADVGPLPSLNVITSTSYGFTFDPNAPMLVTTVETLHRFVADIPSRYREVAIMYERAQVWPVVYIEACLKMARFAATNESGRRWRIEEASIWIARAWNYGGEGLQINEKMSFALIAADLLGDIGAQRKRAFWLRVVTSLLTPMLQRSADEGITASTESRQRATSYIGKICPAYGIEDYDGSASEPQQRSELEVSSVAHQFGWALLQVDVLRECISICEAIGDYDRMVHFSTLLLRRRRDYLHREDQTRVAVSLLRMVNTAIGRGERKIFHGAFWHAGFLRYIEACKQSGNRSPHIRKRLADGAAESGDPFIYNPYAKKTVDTAETVLVVGEPAYVLATFWNPFAFDLEMQDIHLITSGVEFVAESVSAIIPAGAPLTLRMVGTPRQFGTLRILGCSVTVFGGVQQVFYIPSASIEDNDDGQAAEHRRIMQALKQRPKRSGLEAFADLPSQQTPVPATTGDADVSKDDASIDVQVIEEIPLLRVKTTSLSHGAVMLCEGETAQMSITLENTGGSTVDFLLPTFLETLPVPPTATHQHRQSREDTYEQDMFAAHTHAFVWPLNGKAGEVSGSDTRVCIPPGRTYDLIIGLYGKRSCTGGTISLSYGSESEATSDVMYTRQLTVNVLMTVRRTLELLNADVLAVRQRHCPPSDAGAMEMVNQLMQQLSVDAMRRDQWCLLTLDVRNIWSTPFQLTFSVAPAVDSDAADRVESDAASDAEKDHSATSTIQLQPGTAKRILLPIERIALTAEEAGADIPLVNKQFVIAKGPKPSAKEEQLTRQLFWYKESMLKRITATWSCSPNSQGRFDLRAIRLTEPMLDVLRRDVVLFSSSIAYSDDTAEEPTTPATDGRFRCCVGRFINVNIAIRNCSDTPIRLFLRMQPMLDYRNGQTEHNLSQYMVWSGQLQRTLPEIPPQDEIACNLPVYFLRCGRYSLAVHAEDIQTNVVHLGGELEFDVQPAVPASDTAT